MPIPLSENFEYGSTDISLGTVYDGSENDELLENTEGVRKFSSTLLIVKEQNVV